MTVANASTISTPSLVSVNGSMDLRRNYFTQYTSPLLQAVGGSLELESNPSLQNLTLPSLETVGGSLSLINNTNFTTINEIDAVTTVGGHVEIIGPVAM